jgi:prevent-host-death family protein
MWPTEPAAPTLMQHLAAASHRTNYLVIERQHGYGMTTVSLAEAKTRLSELVARVIAGDEICITRCGKPVAKLSAVSAPRKRIDIAALRAVTDGMPMQPESAGEFMRRMRDEERY